MSFFLIIFEQNLFKYENTKKKLAQLQFLIFYYFMHAYAYIRMHAYANIYFIKIFILLRTSDIIFSIYTCAISFNFNHYFIFCYSQN
jgi:hypothetical protein